MLSVTQYKETSFDKLKRRLLKVLRLGKNDVQNVLECAPAGLDAVPVAKMNAIYAQTGLNGRAVIIGYLNPNQLAAEGEYRFYSQDSNGNMQFYQWLKTDGTCEIGGKNDNAVRYKELENAFNQLKSDLNNLVTKFNAHQHTAPPSGGATTGNTAPGNQSNADISQAKIDNIKMPDTSGN